MAIPLTSAAEGTGAAGTAPPWKGLRCLLSYALNIHITKKERVWWRGEGGRAEALGWGQRTPGRLSLPPPKSWRSRTRAPAVLSPPKKRKKRKGEPLWGTHPTCAGARCGWGDGSTPPLHPFSLYLPLPHPSQRLPGGGCWPVRGGGSGAWGLWVAVKAACDRCPPLTALGISPVAPCHWLSAADRQGCSL